MPTFTMVVDFGGPTTASVGILFGVVLEWVFVGIAFVPSDCGSVWYVLSVFEIGFWGPSQFPKKTED